MTWFLIESGVALLLLVFIVWWTMPRRKRPDDSSARSESHRHDPPDWGRGDRTPSRTAFRTPRAGVPCL